MQKLTRFVVVALAPSIAIAETTPTMPAPAATPTFEIEDMRFTSGIEKKMPLDEKTTFSTGDRAWLWLKLKPADDTATITFKWSRNGKEVWTSEPNAVRLGRAWYYKTVDQPGEWKVQILDNHKNLVKETAINVTGDPVFGGTPASHAVATPPTASDDLGVVDLKLATEISDRAPVTPSTRFNKGDKVYTWVKLHVKVPETQMRMRWYLNDAEVYTSHPVTVKQASGWRTWLYKTVDATGDWKVEILDANDKAVHAESFTVN
jgi:hypothetical protein